MSKAASILFLCTGNSCRSQMAEGFARALKHPELRVASAGIEKHGMNPYAIKVMAELGVDLNDQHSKTIDELGAQRFDYVITVCGHAHENCPYFPARTAVIHHGFADPPKLAEGLQDEADILACYRQVRDQIGAYIQGLPKGL